MSVSLSELVHYCTLKVREEEIREQQLRDLAVKAWKLPFVAVVQPAKDGEDNKEAHERRQRMQVLKDRQKMIARDQRMELRKKRRRREEDRDISERIALGQAGQPSRSEMMFDQRLFNQSAGIDSGFFGGSDEKVAVYDKPLFADRSQASIYKFHKDLTSSSARRFAPVEFECEDEEGSC
ncbi:Snw1 [Symbiodinium natans]|uniref:Snw1 protein n=1 Tax=Symbiodinium natans TaxID=878477 RepID=A0A812S0L8_9DINO|nr:Snw1 [Symbiodinium natans]